MTKSKWDVQVGDLIIGLENEKWCKATGKVLKVIEKDRTRVIAVDKEDQIFSLRQEDWYYYEEMSISDLSRPDVLDAYTQAALTGLLASGKCSNDLLPELAVRLAFNTLKEVENLWSKDSSRQKP